MDNEADRLMKEGTKLPSDASAKTKENSLRYCTDPFCTFLLVVCWIAIIVIATFAFKKGEPSRLAQAYDSDNHACGREKGYEDYPYIYFAKPNTTLTSPLNLTVCAKSCPKNETEGSIDCKPNSKVAVCRFSTDPKKPGIEMYSTVPFLGKICVPTEPKLLANVRQGIDIDEANDLWGDLADARGVILYSIFIALAMGLIYMLLVRYFAAALVWGSVALTVLFILLLGIFLVTDAKSNYNKASLTPDAPEQGPMYQAERKNGDMKKAGGFFLIFVAVIIAIAIIILRDSVRRTISVLQATSSFTAQNFLLVLYPTLMFVLFILTFIFFFTVGLYLWSAGELIHNPNQPSPFPTVKFDKTLKTMFWADIIIGIWSLTVNVGLTDWVLASCAVLWFYNENNSKLATSVWRVLRYHLGSISLGSFVLMFIWLVSWIFDLFAYAYEKCKQSSNPALKFFVACFSCCFQCFHRFVRCFNRGAWTMVTLFSATLFLHIVCSKQSSVRASGVQVVRQLH